MPGPRPSKAEASVPLGAVLAGGAASRFPAKLAIVLPRAVAGLGAVLPEVVVVAKADTVVPETGVAVWREPAAPRHPLLGIAWALGRAGGRAVLAVAGDMPELDPAVLRALAADRGSASAVVPRHPGGAEPLCALYRPAAAPVLRRGAEEGRAARAVIAGLAPDWLELAGAASFRNVNRPEDLA